MIPPLTPSSYPARWWVPLPDGRIECRLCPRFCKLNDGQRGFCFVRQREGARILLTTYGRSSGFCVDPIEKKPLNHFLPGTAVLSFGTAGCNLGCRFCQNWDISKARDWDRIADAASPEQIALAAQRLNCRSVAFTYNDPVIFAEYAIDVAEACHARDIRTVAVTAGYITAEARPEFYRSMDAANVDLKAFTEEFYHRLCFAKLAPVLETLIYLHHETNVWLEVTTLLIPGENDSDPELHRAAEWFADHLGPDVPWHFTAFHPDFKMTATPPTPSATLARARRIALSKGLRYVYTGNIHDREGGSTWCPGCGKKLIGRDWYELGEWNISGGRCAFCGREIAGRFEEKPGTWGACRKPVRIGGIAATSIKTDPNPVLRPRPRESFTDAERKQLLDLARRTVREVVVNGKWPDVCTSDLPGIFFDLRGCFVTLTKNALLRGCIGSLTPNGPLFREIMRNAEYAATQDPRFPPVAPGELDEIRIEISVLTTPAPVIFKSPDELLAKLRPNQDGVVLRAGSHSATFLPKVWEKVPDKEAFLGSLARKAGCLPTAWRDPDTAVLTYQAECFNEPDPPGAPHG